MREGEFHLRTARAEELPLAVEIDDDACTLYAEAGLPFDTEREPIFFAREAERWARSLEEGCLLFACAPNGEPVAFAAFGLVDGEPYLHQVSTRRAWMGRGLGRTLVQSVQNWSARGGSLWLTTYDHMAWNRPFYERMGFVKVDAALWGPELRALVDHEQRALPAPEHRIVMRYRHPPGALMDAFGLARIGQIAVPVSDIDRAVAFYRDTLGMRSCSRRHRASASSTVPAFG